MVKRPGITPLAAFELLRENGFTDVHTDTCDLAIEPMQDPSIENMLAFVDGEGDFCNTFAVHKNGGRWTFAG